MNSSWEDSSSWRIWLIMEWKFKYVIVAVTLKEQFTSSFEHKMKRIPSSCTNFKTNLNIWTRSRLFSIAVSIQDIAFSTFVSLCKTGIERILSTCSGKVYSNWCKSKVSLPLHYSLVNFARAMCTVSTLTDALCMFSVHYECTY